MRITDKEAKKLISNELKSLGIKHRIACFRTNIRVVIEDEKNRSKVEEVLNANGFTNCWGLPSGSSDWTNNCLFAYLPGYIIRI